MRLIDRIALNRLVIRLLDLLEKLISALNPKKDGVKPETTPKKRKKIFPNLHIREKKEDE